MRRSLQLTPWQCFCGFTLGWLAVVWVQLARFTLPNMDSMDYLSAALVAERPFSLRWPLLGDFLGADLVWGIHWPGAPLLESVWFSALPPSARALVAVGWFLALWAAGAALTSHLVRRATGDRWLAAAGGAWVLCDRAFFESAQFARPEALSCLVLTAVVIVLVAREEQSETIAGETIPAAPKRSSPSAGWEKGVAVSGFALLPLLHPMTLTVGGVLALYVLAEDWRRWKAGFGVVMTLAFALGACALAAWFFCQPAALAQLQAHSEGARLKATHPGFRPGIIIWEALRRNYDVTFSGHLIYGFAFLGGLVWLFPRLLPQPKAKARDEQATAGSRPFHSHRKGPVRVAALVCFSGLVFAHVFGNPLYLSVLLPCTVVLTLTGLRWLAALGFWRSAQCLYGACAGLVVLQAAHLGGRTSKYLRAGAPNIRAELRAVLRDLPTAGTVLLPDNFWEAAVAGEPRSRYYLATLPFDVAESRRRAYEQARLADTAPGDLLLINTLQFLPMLTTPAPDQWERWGQRQRLYPGRRSWGYDLEIYRRRAYLPPSTAVSPAAAGGAAAVPPPP